MKFDEHGHVVWASPRELYAEAVQSPQRLLSGYLMAGTPCAFATYSQYCDFVEAVAERTGVHARNLYVRGSCHIGFSIAPRSDKLWIVMGDDSDLDLVIVDAVYFHRFEAELRRWEERNPVKSQQEKVLKRPRDGCKTASSTFVATTVCRGLSAFIIRIRCAGLRRWRIAGGCEN